MELRQIRCFVAVAELRHFGRAAQQLHVVQPAVSQQVRRLEHELGVQLFHRTTRTVELTRAGSEFLEHAREILAAVERATRGAQHVHGVSPLLRVATGSGLGSLLGDVLRDLGRAQRDLNVELIRLPERERLRRLADGRLDAAIVRGATGPLPEGVERTPVLTETLIAALPATHTAPQRRTIRLADLATMPARLPGHEENPVLLEALTAACQRIGMTLERVPAGTDEDMLAVIANGPPSWTVFYPHKAELLARQPLPAVAFRRITAPPISVATSIVARADNQLAQAFTDTFRAVAAAKR
jgi:DNA-binding transcriptional LysR family regulator